MDQAFWYWKAMLGFGGGIPTSDILRTEVFSPKYLIEMLVCAFFVYQPFQAHEWVKKLTPMKVILLFIVFLYSIIAMFTQTFNPFLYFQF
jgi:alginate O-acetyltransferase complex protein AlgI